MSQKGDESLETLFAKPEVKEFTEAVLDRAVTDGFQLMLAAFFFLKLLSDFAEEKGWPPMVKRAAFRAAFDWICELSPDPEPFAEEVTPDKDSIGERALAVARNHVMKVAETLELSGWDQHSTAGFLRDLAVQIDGAAAGIFPEGQDASGQGQG